MTFKAKRTLEKVCNAYIRNLTPFCIPIDFYEVDVLKCYDADTITFHVKDDPRIIGDYFKARIYGIDSPERRRKSKPPKHQEELLLMSKYDECLVAALLLSEDFPEQIEERVIIKTMPDKEGSKNTMGMYGRPLCKVYVEISDRIINVLDEFDIPTDVLDTGSEDCLPFYEIGDREDEKLRLVSSEIGSFFMLSDLLTSYGFSVPYSGKTKLNHYEHFIDDEIRIAKLLMISIMLECD